MPVPLKGGSLSMDFAARANRSYQIRDLSVLGRRQIEGTTYMPQPRSISVWPFLGVLVCLSATLVWKTVFTSKQSPQSPHTTQLFTLPAKPLAVTNLLPPPAHMFGEDDDLRIASVEGNSPIFAETKTGAVPTEPVEAADEIATQVIEASSLEESVAADSGPSLTSAIEAPRQPVAAPPTPAAATPPAAKEVLHPAAIPARRRHQRQSQRRQNRRRRPRRYGGCRR